MEYKLVALTGRSGSGKDFLADHLIKHHGYVRVSFSDQLKAIANKIFPWVDLDYLPEDKNQPINHPLNVNQLTPRDIWKKLDNLREVDPEIFVHGVRSKVKELLHNGAKVIITDIRKVPEYKLARHLDAGIIKIETRGEVTTYEDEDIIDQFACVTTFVNHKGQGLRPWEEFCVKHSIIEADWINIIPKLVENQKKENDLFDANIERQHSPEMWRAALLAEYGEFLEEVPHLWKWWKPCPEYTEERKARAIEEFVDVIKFAIGYWIHNIGIDPVDAAENISCGFDVPAIEVVGIDRLSNLISMLAREIQDDGQYMMSVICAISVGCDLLGITREQFASVYHRKYELNESRVNGGYCETGDKGGMDHIHDATCFSVEFEGKLIGDKANFDKAFGYN